MLSLLVRITIAVGCILAGVLSGVGYVFVVTQLIQARVSDEAPVHAEATADEMSDAIRKFQAGTEKAMKICIVCIVLTLLWLAFLFKMNRSVKRMGNALHAVEKAIKEQNGPPG